MTVIKMSIALIVTLLWAKFVYAIILMKTWLIFSTPGTSLPLGLVVGKLVLNALNKAEWVFALAVSGNLLLSKNPILSADFLLLLLSVSLLIKHTIWSLPYLDVRAELHIKGQAPFLPA